MPRVNPFKQYERANALQDINQKKLILRLKAISIFSIGLGVLVLLGWIFDITILKSIFLGYVTMKINTAICFILSGIAFLSLIIGKWNNISKVITILLILIAVDSILNIDYGIFPSLIPRIGILLNDKNLYLRSPHITHLSFFFIGISFLLINSRSLYLKKIAQYSLHTITIISLISFLTSLNDILNFKRDIVTNIPAIHTTLYLFILSIGISFLQQDLGYIKIFTGNKIGNILSRIIFPKIFLSLLIISIIDIFIHENNLFPEEFVIAITITFFLIAILYIIGLNVKKINQIDDLRIEAENKIIDVNKNLENRILERTTYLIKQNDVLENFAYIVSHNLRAPVSNLRPLLQFYKKEMNIEKKDIYIDKIEISINNLNNTLNELLDVIAIRNDLKSETLIFESILLEIIESYKGQIIETGAQITYDFSKVPEIEYPSIYLESIIQNLLSNALKYKSPERIPVIHFETKLINNKIQLSIIDNGLGIDLEENGNLLFGFHKTFHKHPEAKGLGLFLIKKQIEIMGGNITAKSQVNKGTTFEIIF